MGCSSAADWASIPGIEVIADSAPSSKGGLMASNAAAGVRALLGHMYAFGLAESYRDL